jgi:hypothetical protein
LNYVKYKTSLVCAVEHREGSVKGTETEINRGRLIHPNPMSYCSAYVSVKFKISI